MYTGVLQRGPQLETLIRNASTNFGCAGQQCYEICTPAEVEELTSVTGERKESERHSTLFVDSYTF